MKLLQRTDLLSALTTGLLTLFAASAAADEGMWTFHDFPAEMVQQRHGVSIDPKWLDRVRQSVTRHESGCTGSFISGDGLVLTNHHCIIQCLSRLSNAKDDLIANGFVSANRQQERKCPGEMLSVLIATQDITKEVEAATRGLSPEQANSTRKATLSRLEAECAERSKKTKDGPLACESVTLYQGGQYFLYKYRRYDDVRLAFAPHEAIAAFGGDPDNFNFPRWCLDFSLLRAYEKGVPAKTPTHLTWRVDGAAAGASVFVIGHPGTTQRLFTPAQLDFQRDTALARYIPMNSEYRGRLIQWSKADAEQARIAQDALGSLENSLKVYRSLHRALLDEKLMSAKRKEAQTLREMTGRDPKLVAQIDQAHQAIDTAMARYRQIYDQYLFLESGSGFNSRLFDYARSIVRAHAERGLPNEKRLREYAESNLPKIEAQIRASTPIYPAFEQLKLSFSLDKMREILGPDDPTVRELLSRASPDTLARELVTGTQLADPDLRAKLWMPSSQVNESKDSMIVLARSLDAKARAVRKLYEDEVQAPVARAQEQLARARFALLGTSTYPDATFTLRVSFGKVSGWEENGKTVEPFTHLERLYARATGEKPFAIPEVWTKARGRLDARTSFNFVTTNDIVGGNSGSPVVDAEGKLVGLAFDGNMHSIAGRYGYDAALNRAVAVHPAIMLTALRDVYPAKHLAEEITGSAARPTQNSP